MLSMAVLANAVFHTFPKSRPIKLFEDKSNVFRMKRCFLQFHISTKTPQKRLTRVSLAEFGNRNSVNLQIGIAREKLYEVVPESAKDFPWKEARTSVVDQLLLLGKKTLKWLLLGFFISSFVSDVILSISRNKELMIPLGLFVGCLFSDFLSETAKEFFHSPEEDGLKKEVIAISGLFVLVKLLSSYFRGSAQVFLLQAANGGLMQVLWLWRHLLMERGTPDNLECST